MDFGFSQELSEDVSQKGDIITELSQNTQAFFKNKNYGLGVHHFVIGIICVAPQFDFFFKIRKKYTKSKKLLEYNVKLIYDAFQGANEKEIKEMIAESVVNSLGVVEELQIKDFDLAKFRDDLVLLFNQNISEPLSTIALVKPKSDPVYLTHQAEKNGSCSKKESRITFLTELLKEKKYLSDGFAYNGAVIESKRTMFEKELNDFVQELINKDNEITTKDQLLKFMRKFLYSSSPTDSEDREYIASYMEKILDVYSISSSDGLLNEWMYGFNLEE